MTELKRYRKARPGEWQSPSVTSRRRIKHLSIEKLTTKELIRDAQALWYNINVEGGMRSSDPIRLEWMADELERRDFEVEYGFDRICIVNVKTNRGVCRSQPLPGIPMIIDETEESLKRRFRP